MEGINDIYRCNPCPSEKKGELNNVGSIVNAIMVIVYEYNIIDDKLILRMLHRMTTCETLNMMTWMGGPYHGH